MKTLSLPNTGSHRDLITPLERFMRTLSLPGNRSSQSGGDDARWLNGCEGRGSGTRQCMTPAERYQNRRAENAGTTAEAILHLIEPIIHK
jgi:hypothetical protein